MDAGGTEAMIYDLFILIQGYLFCMAPVYSIVHSELNFNQSLSLDYYPTFLLLPYLGTYHPSSHGFV